MLVFEEKRAKRSEAGRLGNAARWKTSQTDRNAITMRSQFIASKVKKSKEKNHRRPIGEHAPHPEGRAKRTIARFSRPCIAAACLLLAFTVLARAFSVYAGGALYYLMLDIRQFPMETGLWRADPTLMTTLMSMLGLERLGDLGGMVFALSDAVSGLVIVLPVAWRQLINLGRHSGHRLPGHRPSAIRRFDPVPQYSGGPPRSLPQRAPLVPRPAPYRQGPGGTGAADPVAVDRAAGVHGARPSLPHRRFRLSQWGVDAPALLIPLHPRDAGRLLSLYAPPPRPLSLAQSPGLSVRQALSRGFRLLTSRRGDYFKLNLSFLPLQVLSMVLWNIPNLYLVPYMELSNYLFLDPPPDPEAPPVAL